MSGNILPPDYQIRFIGNPPSIAYRDVSVPHDAYAPVAASPLDEYRGAGSATIRRIRSIVESHPGGEASNIALGGAGAGAGAGDGIQYNEARATTVLYEAHEALVRILGRNHPRTLALRQILAD